MAMAVGRMALGQIQRMLGGWMDDILAVVGGIADGFLLENIPLLFIAKAIGVPILDKLVLPLPKGLVHQSEGGIGLLIWALMLGGK